VGHDNKTKEANVVATAVHIAGGPRRVSQHLGVSRSQVYRWVAAGTMSHAIYLHVSALAKLSGIRTNYLCGEILGDAEISYFQNGHTPVASKPKRNTAKPDATIAKPDAPSAVARLRLTNSSGRLSINPTSVVERTGSRQLRAIRSRESSR